MQTGSSNHSYYVCMCTQVCVVVFTEDVFCALGAHHSHVVLVTPFIMIWFVVLSGALQQTHFSVWSLGPGRLTAQTHRHLYNQCLHFIDPVGMCLIMRLCQLRSSSSCAKSQNRNSVECECTPEEAGSESESLKFEMKSRVSKTEAVNIRQIHTICLRFRNLTVEIRDSYRLRSAQKQLARRPYL